MRKTTTEAGAGGHVASPQRHVSWTWVVVVAVAIANGAGLLLWGALS